MAVLRLFAAARLHAGISVAELPGTTVSEVLAEAVERYGADFADVLDSSVVWLNGSPARPDDPVDGQDEIAVLPPVSGGSA